jgi:solute carrier family 13 (sodium-dependent dicarboxylate transporter), member 2/3/5
MRRMRASPHPLEEPTGAPPRLHEGRAAPPSLPAHLRSRKVAVITATVAISVAAYWLTREALGEMAARSFSIIIVAAAFWATEVLPLFATAFVVVGLEILALATEGGLAADLTALLQRAGVRVHADPAVPPIGAAAFLAPLADDIIILFLGAFLLAAAVRKHRVDERLARRILRPFASSPTRLVYGVLGVTAFFSMWMSNTAMAAMMLAIIGPTVRRLPEHATFRMAILLAVPFGANIGGIGTPIGTPPNAIAYGVLNQAGYDVTFLTWMLVAVPLAIMLLLAAGVVLMMFFGTAGHLDLGFARDSSPLETGGRATLAILVATVLLWILSDWHGLRPGAVALLAAAALTAFGVLDREDVDSIDWNILILMWGALSLSVAAGESGLLAQVRRVDLTALPGGLWTTGLVIGVAAVGLSTVMSNTATAALLVPAALAVSLPGREQFAMLAALCCSFGMALPVSTPPNAIAYATATIPLRTMIRAGGTLSIVCLILVLLGYRAVLPLVF